MQVEKDYSDMELNEEQDEQCPNVFQNLIDVFQGRLHGISLKCDACGNEYEVKILKDGQGFNDFRIICCLFCGQQIKLY